VVDLFQLNQVYTSIWFLILVALIASSLIYSIYYQSKILVKTSRPTKRDVTQSSFRNYYAFRLVPGSGFSLGKLAHEIGTIFRARGYRPYLSTQGSRYFIFGKNRCGRWGGVIFHVGLLFIIVAALYSLAFQKRGFVQLIPTDTFQGKDEDWGVKKLGVLASDFNLGFQVHLKDFTPTYWENDQVKDLVSRLTFVDEQGKVKELSVAPAKPVVFKGTKVYQATDYGYAPGFILKKEGEKDLVMTHFFLDAPGKKDQPFKGKMDFPTTDYILDMEFYPNLIEPSWHATLPGVHLTVTENGEERFKGRVLFSQTALLGSDELTFRQIRYWTGLAFVKHYGMPLVYLSFALGTLGAILIFIFPYKQVYIKVTQEKGHVQLFLGGRAGRYGPLFSEEFRDIAGRLEGRLREHGNHSAA